MLSATYFSNLYTMGVASKVDNRQSIPEKPYVMPNEETRFLRAKLIMEEALETVRGLGYNFVDGHLSRREEGPSLEAIIDGCCDVNYVTTGTLVACGVPDMPHYAEVNHCNNSKFPLGEVFVNEYGKFLKPKGWVGPDHANVQKLVEANPFHKKDLPGLAKHLINEWIRNGSV